MRIHIKYGTQVTLLNRVLYIHGYSGVDKRLVFLDRKHE